MIQGGNNAGYEYIGSIISDTTFITRSFFFFKKKIKKKRNTKPKMIQF